MQIKDNFFTDIHFDIDVDSLGFGDKINIDRSFIQSMGVSVIKCGF